MADHRRISGVLCDIGGCTWSTDCAPIGYYAFENATQGSGEIYHDRCFLLAILYFADKPDEVNESFHFDYGKTLVADILGLASLSE